jgi:mannosyl-3-phosphoglycerate phosphatase
LPAVKLLSRKEIPLIFCSAKTRAEQEAYREELGILDPFIVENGGAIFIPQDYFPFSFEYRRIQDGYLVIELGTSYQKLRDTLQQIRLDTEADFRGFGDMSVEEVAGYTGLSLEAAYRAKQRGYDETLRLEGETEEVEKILDAIRKAGLNYAPGGCYYDVMRGNDKGRAATILIELFRRKLGELKTVGLGDSLNDLPLFSVVDIPILVQKPGGYWEEMKLSNLWRIEGVGPEGFGHAIEGLVKGDTI